MAIGDAAAAAGMDIVPGTAKVRGGANEINKTRDYIAQRTSTVTPVARGGTGATTPAAARNALGVTAANVPSGTGSNVQNDLNYLGTSKADVGHNHDARYYLRAQVDAAFTSRDNAINAVSIGQMNPAIYSRGTSGSWRSLAIQADGVLAHTASARRFKKNIKPLDITDEQVQAIRVVTFDWKTSGDSDFGVIADELADAGLDDFVVWDDNGDVLGVHYERLALALLPALQRNLSRLDALESRLDALEGNA